MASLLVKKNKRGRSKPGERFLSNTGGADVSIRTLESHLQYRRNPRPRRQRISQATGIGNSAFIIDDEAELREFLVRGEPGVPARRMGETPVTPQAC
jgi:hypothetical protein